MEKIAYRYNNLDLGLVVTYQEMNCRIDGFNKGGDEHTYTLLRYFDGEIIRNVPGKDLRIIWLQIGMKVRFINHPGRLIEVMDVRYRHGSLEYLMDITGGHKWHMLYELAKKII